MDNGKELMEIDNNKPLNEEPVKMETESENPRKRKLKQGEVKKRRKLGVIAPKTPLMQLNELKPGLKYQVETQEGLPHEPVFVVSVEINNEKYIGKGSSKKLAKHAAAQQALQSFVQLMDMTDIHKTSLKSLESWDFTIDNFENEKPVFKGLECLKGNDGSEEANNAAAIAGNKEKIKKKVNLIEDFRNKNPIVLLNEVYPKGGIVFKLIKENSNIPGQRFTMAVTINEKNFEGSGSNKKLAKAAAARSALCNLLNINYNLSVAENMESCNISNDLPQFPQTCADKIARAVYDKFSVIMEGNEEQAKWKVLAGVAMTTDAEMENVTVVGVSTGTKCINGEHMSMNGQSLNDCHAEIISRRCLKSFLYLQLDELTRNENKENSIFMASSNGKFCLKPDIKFHLFISTSPCGDARIFSPHDESIDKHPNRKARGLLRTKIESGEGTIPVKSSNIIQTWDGIIQGQQRLLTMSCSDKIASWNSFGLQGALLSHFIEPIYLESIILGSLFHPNHMVRAMWGRFENFSQENMIAPYKLNKPKMCCTTSLEGRHVLKSPNFSSNWSFGKNPKAEIVNATTGKTYTGCISQISKKDFFMKFMSLYDLFKPKAEKNFKLYSEAKASATDYQEAKKIFRESLIKNNLGMWVKKPVEQEQFEAY